jgi:hypothetical protein
MSSSSIGSVFSSRGRWSVDGKGQRTRTVPQLRALEEPPSGVGFEASRPRL